MKPNMSLHHYTWRNLNIEMALHAENMNIEMSLRHHMEEPEYRNVITCKNMNTEMQLRLLAQRVTRFAHHFEISSELLNQSGCAAAAAAGPAAAAGAAPARPGSISGAYSKKPCNSNNAWYYT